ncbi:MAG: UDP-N-acetylmuramate--L-alanine ligase [Thermoanaerobaculia bacterium]
MIFDQFRTIHFVGIGGIGMSGLAEILNGAGLTVTGCDLKRSAATDLLASRGIAVTIGHDPSHVAGNDLVVITSAVKGEHAEVDAARMNGVRIMKRAEVLGAIVNEKRSIGVAGTHGKTTTSAMISIVLEEAGLDPTMLVGGMVRNLKTNAKRGAGDLLVVEADEYDRTFHHLHPEIAVVTNIEPDHLEYYKTFENILEAFRIFVGGVKRDGLVIGCADDEDVARLLRHAEQRRVGYGLSEGADLRAVNLEFNERGSSFEVPGVGFFKLFIPGEHNVRNALAAIAVGLEVGLDGETIASGLAKFLGVDRRFQILGTYQGAIVVDDYAHHPTEIRATLEAARGGYPGRRVIALFQPHLYSRTRDFAKEFGEALLVADVPIVTPIYAAREHPEEGVSARLISDSVQGVEFLDRSHAQIINEMRRRLRPNDIFIVMGAGDVHEIAEEIVRGEEA